LVASYPEATGVAQGDARAFLIATGCLTDGRFIAYDNGTVSDTRTRLMWAAKDNVADINWQHATSYCERYRGGGYTDWRMPTQGELEGLYDSEVTGGTGYHLTNLIKLTGCCPWASETRGSEAAALNFGNGNRYWNHPSISINNRALPVRSDNLY